MTMGAGFSSWKPGTWPASRLYTSRARQETCRLFAFFYRRAQTSVREIDTKGRQYTGRSRHALDLIQKSSELL